MAQHPEDFPLVKGVYQMTKKWQIDLGELEFRRRFEDGSLVIWRPGITLWIGVWGYPEGETREEFISKQKQRKDLPEGANVINVPDSDHISHFGYFFYEEENGRRRWSLQTYTFGSDGHVNMAIYFDEKEKLEVAKRIWTGLRPISIRGNEPADAGPSS